jgi:magnesium and cobalt transporter
MSGESAPPKPGWLERISALLLREPEDREQSMIEGVLQVSEMQARDIMIPRAQMDMIDVVEAPDKFVPLVIQTNHSRFPVFEADRDHVIGILLAKDLLRYYAGEEEFNVRDMLRPAVFIPESKQLNVLLKDFRANRNHMAIVVDEYGGVAGLVTIEDVLEQIVGDIEDEYDFDETADDIIADHGGGWRVKAATELAKFDATFGTRYAGEEQDTVGGLVLNRLGRLPKRGEQLTIDELTYKVLRADSRRLHLLLVEKKTGAK